MLYEQHPVPYICDFSAQDQVMVDPVPTTEGFSLCFYVHGLSACQAAVEGGKTACNFT